MTPFGTADARATVLAVSGAALPPEVVRLDRSSLASQAVGPPLNGMEMSYDGRAFVEMLQGVGRDGSRAHSLQEACIP